MNLDISIKPPVVDKPGALFTVVAASLHGEYPVVTVCSNGYWKHILPVGSPFKKFTDGGIYATYEVKEI